MAPAQPSTLLVFFHHYWLALVTVSCTGAMIDVGYMSTSRPSFAGFLVLFFPIWLSLDLYLYGSVCNLLGYSPRLAPFAGPVRLWHRLFTRSRAGPAVLIALSLVWLLVLPAVLVEFWIYLFFQTPAWWNRWMYRGEGVPPSVAVAFVIFICLFITVGWATLIGWVVWRAFKAFWSVRLVLDDIATLEERARLADGYYFGEEDEDDGTLVGVEVAPAGPAGMGGTAGLRKSIQRVSVSIGRAY